ncbi:MAG: ABC transporter ATP-binding protein [Cellulosilyticaceae bacterium]
MSYFVASDIAKSYDGREIIKEISLEVQKGELVSLLGVSGIGKTTLFNVLSGLEKPDSGEVYLDEEEITGCTGIASYMQQKDLLLPYKRVIDNIALPLVIKGMKKKEARQEVCRYLKQFGLEHVGEHYPTQLSGGMRQRAALLRSYLFSSKLMLLDEPFSALDAITKHHIHDWYLDTMKEMGTTTLLITHDIDEAILLSDRIYVMAGNPGTITHVFEIKGNKTPQGKCVKTNDFTTSEVFIAYKKALLTAIE